MPASATFITVISIPPEAGVLCIYNQCKQPQPCDKMRKHDVCMAAMLILDCLGSEFHMMKGCSERF